MKKILVLLSLALFSQISFAACPAIQYQVLVSPKVATVRCVSGSMYTDLDFTSNGAKEVSICNSDSNNSGVYFIYQSNKTGSDDLVATCKTFVITYGPGSN